MAGTPAASAAQGPGPATPKPLKANLICGAPLYNHDFDFARQRLLTALYEAGGLQTNVARNYDDSDAIETGDLLVSYTSQVPVEAARCEAIRRYLEKGGRWFALHASNSVRDNKILPGLLGSRFLAHPPYTRYAVSIAKPTDPLLAGIEPFEVDDELYLVEQSGDIDVLLHTRWGGTAMGRTFDEKMQPLMYRHRVGNGGVLYLALGHSAREFDRPAAAGPNQATLRGPWDLPVYQELVRRGIAWAAKRREPA
jgi:type 1 glutamine amidotransferase